MTGFLQRLVSSAQHPAPRVHPLLTPMFSAQESRAEDESVSGEDVTASMVSLDKTSPLIEDAEPSNTKSRIHETTAAFIPISPAIHTSTEASAERHPADRSRNAGEVPTQNPIALRPRVSAGERESASDRAPEYVPLLRERSAPSPSLQSDLPAIQSPRTVQTRGDNRQQLQSAMPNKTAPDEIQISIGRIEVTAVHETRARPLVKPTRKQLSLDEYLKRADARRG